MAAEPSDAEIQSAMAVILREGELSQLTSRIVRNQLEDKFGVSFLGRKKEIDRMLMEMIENQEKSTEDEKEQENGTNEMNGVEQGKSDEDEESSENDEPSPKKMKQDPKKESSKAHSDSDDDSDNVNDAELARKLHEKEKGLRARKQTTRKPGERKKSAKAKKPKESKGENKKGFGKLMVLSPELAEVMGEEKMCRSDVVKRMWAVIRERKLEDPKNKRFTICDEQLLRIFGRKRIQTFGMMKYLTKHIKDPEHVV